MIFNLNRSDKLILENCPNELLIFLLQTCGKKVSTNQLIEKREKIIKYIKEYKNCINLDNLNNESLQKISMFIGNEKEKWEKDNLVKAFEHIKENKDYDKIFGVKSNNNPYNYDICMLYKLCKSKEIELDQHTTFDQMKSLYLNSFKMIKSREELYNTIIQNLSNQDVNILSKIEDLLVETETNYQEEDLKININYLVSRSCLNSYEAIIYGFKFFGIDLSSSKYPIKSLFLLNESKINNTDFVPLTEDTHFYNMYIKNKDFYNVDKFWKKDFSKYYTQKNMENISNYEECDYSQIEDRYEEKNFYKGLIPGCEKTHTFINNSELSGELLSYGTINEPENMIVLNTKELIEYLKIHNYFKEFESEDIIDPYSINKLLNISKEIDEELKREILRVKTLGIDNVPYVKKFLEKYLMVSDNIDNLFKEIQIMCYTARGWKEGEAFPISKEQIKEYEGDLSSNIQNIRRNLSTFDTSLFDKLPLMKYKNKEFVHSNCSLRDAILEKYERINIDNYTIILQSCYYYLKLINNKEIFPISSLEFFS